jgi:hypothetical protein
MCDNLDNLRIRGNCMFDRRDIGFIRLPALTRDLGGEAHSHVCLDIVGGAAAVGGKFIIVKFSEVPGEVDLRRDGVAATIDLSDH